MRQDKNAVIQRKNWYLIPDYPNDLVAAMGALIEYGHNQSHTVSMVYKPNSVKVNQFYVEINGCEGLADTLPQAICLAIVAHREGE